jgi:hypothetical protein
MSADIKRKYIPFTHETISPPSNAEVKNAWSYTSPHPIRLHDVVLNEAQGQLYLASSYFMRQ